MLTYGCEDDLSTRGHRGDKDFLVAKAAVNDVTVKMHSRREFPRNVFRAIV